jgi:hypothetical protein
MVLEKHLYLILFKRNKDAKEAKQQAEQMMQQQMMQQMMMPEMPTARYGGYIPRMGTGGPFMTQLNSCSYARTSSSC